jgi:hypothetical protein
MQPIAFITLVKFFVKMRETMIGIVLALTTLGETTQSSCVVSPKENKVKTITQCYGRFFHNTS